MLNQHFAILGIEKILKNEKSTFYLCQHVKYVDTLNRIPLTPGNTCFVTENKTIRTKVGKTKLRRSKTEGCERNVA